VSRLPRAQEFLKTGFNAEAASAARLRAAAVGPRARAGRTWRAPCASWRSEKDALALTQLEAAGQVPRHRARPRRRPRRGALRERRALSAHAREVDEETAGIFRDVVARQQQHAERLEGMLDAVTRSHGDLPA
jgi:hypothetical protein